MKNKTLLQSIDDVIDFYTTWMYKSPSKNIYKGSIYDGFKIIEKYCNDDEIKNIYNYLFLD